MKEAWFNFILALIPVFGAIITGVVAPYIKEKIGNEKLAKYAEWAAIAVQGAEMMFAGQGMGATKKEYVVNFLDKMFNAKKVIITPEQIEILLESAVKEMKMSEGK